MRNVTQISFLLMKTLKHINANLLCTVSAINLRIAELSLSKKCDTNIDFDRKTSEVYRCQFIVHIPASAGGFYETRFYTPMFALTLQPEKYTWVPHTYQ